MGEIKEIEAGLKKGDNPKTHKSLLAREIVTIYHSGKSAQKAEAEFDSVHRDKATPSDMPIFKIPAGEKIMPIIDLLVYIKLASSKSGARRLVEQGGVKIGGETAADWKDNIQLKTGLVIQVGSRKFVKLA